MNDGDGTHACPRCGETCRCLHAAMPCQHCDPDNDISGVDMNDVADDQGSVIRCICNNRGDNPACPIDHDQISHEFKEPYE